MTVKAAILYPAVCISDTISKAGICGKLYQLCQEPSLFCSSLVKSEPAHRSSDFNFRKVLLLYEYWYNSWIRPADENICTFSIVWGQLASSAWFSFNMSAHVCTCSALVWQAWTWHSRSWGFALVASRMQNRIQDCYSLLQCYHLHCSSLPLWLLLLCW